MDLLRSPGGCPWDAEQTHESLVPFALEEAYELAEAVEAGDRVGMREELGDLLLQVVFHARLAQEHATDRFDVDDVARDVVDKLVRRHPHVFAADGTPHEPGEPGEPVPPGPPGQAAERDGADPDPHVRWDRIKRAEKQRTSALEGIPLALGALARGQKVMSRAHRSGLVVDVAAVARDHARQGPDAAQRAADVGARLLALTAEAHALGVDAEAALRGAVRALEAAVRTAEGE
ncbi:nucleoside triphosphate pyrophosphohydrolase [Cellulomonas fimi]|uniref:Nucleoside triphosphate pyrophosphohydrolase n=2 Tax=Cellulomonas fimi TaxID=1708 RepID=A0A7Y0M0G7_CELFI|nr:nucleoside triphosphate pyrophosphohydrolase [Cellulomonas fimi]